MDWLQSFLFLYLFLVKEAVCIKHSCIYIHYRGKNQTDKHTTCPDNIFCKRGYNISYVNIPPYSMNGIIEPVLRKCCGDCVSYKIINIFKNITEISSSSLQNSDFIVPFLGSFSKVTLYGHHFIPVYFAPTAFYITGKPDSIFARLLKSCRTVYPLIIICIFMAVISGFIAWIIETWYNKEEFPRSFLIGWFEGIWWSFVSMTTVGYGDKTPKSVSAKIFSVLWILIGITMFSMFTGLLTTAIMDANKPLNPDMRNADVGVLKYRAYDASLIALQGGNVIETNGWNFCSDINQLMEKLRNKKVDGILLDKYTFWLVSKWFWFMKENDDYSSLMYCMGIRKDNELKANIEFFLHYTIRTKKTYDGERLSYGIPLKDEDVYEYFRDAIIDNHL